MEEKRRELKVFHAGNSHIALRDMQSRQKQHIQPIAGT